MDKKDTRDLRPAVYAASYVGKSPQTLANWRWRGIGPKYYKINGYIMYDMADVDAWLDEQVVETAS